MFKMLLGAAIVVALVGYGVLTPETLEDAGARMKQGINNGAQWVKEQTEPTPQEQLETLVDKVTK
jgi:hypothetical protein